MSLALVRILAVLVIVPTLYACATAPAAKNRLVPACRQSEVLYCADQNMCTCLSQGAAQQTVDSL